jgi:polysaccharide export outer membrane protein
VVLLRARVIFANSRLIVSIWKRAMVSSFQSGCAVGIQRNLARAGIYCAGAALFISFLLSAAAAQDNFGSSEDPTSSSSNDEYTPAVNNNRPPAARGTGPVILSSKSSRLDRVLKSPNVLSVPNDYVIGEQDQLTVTIWKEHDLSGSVVVRPDGKITVPLVGEVKVVGMKPLDLQNLLAERLKPFITVPQVTVAVNQINSRRVYLIGQVVKEGTFEINGSTTVLQMIAEAGGLRDFAKRKSIYILRQSGDQQIRYPFNYEAVIRGRKREQNIRLEPGDTVVVP